MFDSLVHATRDGSWLGGRRFDASLSRLLDETKRAGVRRACLVAIAEHVENDFVLECTRAHPQLFVPIAGLNPIALASPRAAATEVERLAAEGFSGIKLHPRLNRYDPLDERALAAIRAAGGCGLVVFLDTLFRRPGLATRHCCDVIDIIVNACDARVVLLHAGGPHILGLFELGRMYSNVLLDLSFTLLRYAGSSLDDDVRFMCRNLDQRLCLGSDFPEYTPAEVLARFDELLPDLPAPKRDAILIRNLEQFLK